MSIRKNFCHDSIHVMFSLANAKKIIHSDFDNVGICNHKVKYARIQRLFSLAKKNNTKLLFTLPA